MASLIDASTVATIDPMVERHYGSTPIQSAIDETIVVIREWIATIESSTQRKATWNEIRSFVQNHQGIIESHRQRPRFARTTAITPYGITHGQYRRITRNVLTAPTLIGDRTDNGARRHKRNADNVGSHVDYRAHRLSDMTVRNDIDGTSATLSTSGRFPLIRNNDGTVNAAASLRLASQAGIKLASNKKVG